MCIPRIYKARTSVEIVFSPRRKKTSECLFFPLLRESFYVIDVVDFFDPFEVEKMCLRHTVIGYLREKG